MLKKKAEERSKSIVPVLYEGSRCRKNSVVAWDAVPPHKPRETRLVVDAHTWAD